MDFLAVLTVFLASSLGTPYDYGGNNPITGYDCSGFVNEYMRTFGVGPPDRLSAQHMSDWFHAHPEETIQQWGTINGIPPIGTLVFFGKSLKSITHVGIMINDSQMAEAGGGDRRVLTKQEAAAKNAFVRIRPISGRKDWQEFIIPKYPISTGYYQTAKMSIPYGERP